MPFEGKLCILNETVYTVFALYFGMEEFIVELSFQTIQLEYAARTGNLDVEAAGVVKSKKHFPYYRQEDGTVVIFKPLSKTKPCLTPLFAYAEVFWSHVINHYFMPVPRYQLAICHGYSKEEPKYYDHGTLVPSVCGKGEYLINLLEFFKKHPDPHVNIDEYVNYCMIFYDYTQIFESAFMQQHEEIAEELAWQVLLSILKGDQNYHYENVAFICDDEGNVLRLAPMIDHEYSTMFLFPDSVTDNVHFFLELLHSIQGKKPVDVSHIKDETERKVVLESSQNLNRNICYIKEYYPKVVASFLEKLERFENELAEITLRNEGYLFPCNSDAYHYEMDLSAVQITLKNEIEDVAKRLRKELQ